MKSFQVNIYPERKELHQLSKSLNTSLKRVANWFCSMRRKGIREGMLPESEQCSVVHYQYSIHVEGIDHSLILTHVCRNDSKNMDVYMHTKTHLLPFVLFFPS